MQIKPRRPALVWAVLTVLALALMPVRAPGQVTLEVLMPGLDNPRGLAFGPDGGLYVAEAGRGGNGPSIVLSNGNLQFYGASGAVSRLLNGVQERILTGLPSLAPAGGFGATGPHDVTFNVAGDLHYVVGWGGPPADRANLDSVGEDFAKLYRAPSGGSPVVVADIAAHEQAFNPAGGPLDSNPFGVQALNGAMLVTDAGGNSLLQVAADGTITTVATFPSRPNASTDAVPTRVVVGPDGAYYVSQLTGFPFTPGAANIFRVVPGEDPTIFASGLTNVVDLAFGPNGDLFALEIAANGLASGDPTGALVRVNPGGAHTTLLSDGLFMPTGLLIDRQGRFYISNFGIFPEGGQVIRVTAVPEPGALALLLGGLVSGGGFVLGLRRRRA